MEKTNKNFKYCGGIIDHSWFDDPEAYDKGTYTAHSVNFCNGTEVWNNEWYQFIDNSKKVYLDEYPEQEKLRKEFFDSFLLYKNRFGQNYYKVRISKMIARYTSNFTPPSEEYNPEDEFIDEIIKCSLFSEHSNPLEHFYRRFMRRD